MLYSCRCYAIRMRRSEDKDPYIEDRIDNFRKQCGDNHVHFPRMVETQRYVKFIDV
jgi:hypothetical protein